MSQFRRAARNFCRRSGKEGNKIGELGIKAVAREILGSCHINILTTSAVGFSLPNSISLSSSFPGEAVQDLRGFGDHGGLDNVWTAALNSSKAAQEFGVAGLAELGLSHVNISKGEIASVQYRYNSNAYYSEGKKLP